MFDPNKRRIVRKADVWNRVQNGELMTLSFDSETSGIGRQDVPYRTPGYQFYSEWGDCLLDISGNWHNNAEIKFRRPEWKAFEVPAALMYRDRTIGPDLYDDPERMCFSDALAARIWRTQQAAVAYEQVAQAFGDKLEKIDIIDHNRNLRKGEKPGQIRATDFVYGVPLLDNDGKIVFDVRYHPDRRKFSYRFRTEDQEGTSLDYRGEDNIFYTDESDGSTWKWVDPGLFYTGHNILNYDTPHDRANLYMGGLSPQNSTMLYARSTPTSRQIKKPHMLDTRHVLFWQSVLGTQAEDRIEFGKIVDPVTWKIRNSEALGAYHAANKGQAIPGRMLRGGPSDPRDGSYFDLSLAHGSSVDAAAAAAGFNLSMDRDAGIVSMLYDQSDSRKLYEFLSQQSVKGDKLPVFFLPHRDAGKVHSVMPYWFLDPDDQAGRFSEIIFFKTDGSFHTESHRGKALKDLSVDEWVEYIHDLKKKRDPGSPIRVERVRRWGGAMTFEMGMQRLARHSIDVKDIDGIGKDMKFIKEHPEMRARVLQAMAVVNYQRRLERKLPQNEYLEDALGRKYSGEILYQEEARILEERMIWERTGKGGAQAVHGILRTLETHMNRDYKRMIGVDEALDQLMTAVHPINWYRNIDLADRLHEQETDQGVRAREILQDWVSQVERIITKFRTHKDWPYVDIFESLINPATGQPFIKGNKFKVDTLGEAYKFREMLRERAQEDFELLMELKDSPYTQGFTGKDFGNYYYNGRRRQYKGRHLLIHANADNGQGPGGPAPHIVDKNGHEVPLEVIKGMNRHIDYGKGSSQTMQDSLNKLLKTGEWRIRFYVDPTEPGITRLNYAMVDIGLMDKLSPAGRQLYFADFINRMEGMTTEDVSTDRIPTLRTMKQSCKAIRAYLTGRDHRLLEREVSPYLSAAFKALKPEEALQKLSWIEAWIRRQERVVAARKKELETPAIRRTDPDSGLALDYIPITIPRDSGETLESDPNFILMDVPIWHMRNHVEQDDPRLPPKFLVVPAIGSQFRQAANKEQGAKPVLVRGIEDGRIAATGRRTRIETFNQKDPSLGPIWQKVKADYGRAGTVLDEKSHLWMVAVEGVYPLAGTRKVDSGLASIKLPKSHFDAMVTPGYANMGDTPLRAVLMPTDYFPQQLSVGEKILLRQMDTDMFSNIQGETEAQETGHSYVSRITKIYGLDESTGEITGIRRRDFLKMVESGRISKEHLKAAGFVGGSVQHVRQVLDRLVTEKWKSNPDDMPLVLIAFQKVNKDTYSYTKRTGPPHAAFSWDGQPVTPDME